MEIKREALSLTRLTYHVIREIDALCVCQSVYLSVCLSVSQGTGMEPTRLFSCLLVWWCDTNDRLYTSSHMSFKWLQRMMSCLRWDFFSWRFLLNLIQRQMPNQPGQILNKLRKLKIWLFGKISLFPFDSQAVDIMLEKQLVWKQVVGL